MVAQAIRLLRQVAERQALRASEEGYRLKLQQDLEEHASFTHKIVSGKAQPVQLPIDALHWGYDYTHNSGRKCGAMPHP